MGQGWGIQLIVTGLPINVWPSESAHAEEIRP